MSNMNLDLDKEDFIYLCQVMVNNFAPLEMSTGDTYDNNQFKRLQAKIFAAGAKHFDIYEIHDNLKTRGEKQNQFTDKPIFMGGGFYTQDRCNTIHQRLKYALYVLGGKQQNGGQGTEFDEQSDKEDEMEIKKVLKDIMSAFGYQSSDL